MNNSTAEEILHLTFQIGRFLRRHQLPSGPRDLNFLQIRALIAIKEKPGMTMKELARELKVTSPSATSFVNRLVKFGWVRRVSDPDNRKLVRLTITPSAKRMLAVKLAQRKRMLASVLQFIPVSDQRELKRILTTLVGSLPSA